MNELVDLKSYKEANINSYADEISNDVKEGYLDPIKTIVHLKAVKKITERAIDSICDDAIDKAGNYAKGERIYNGASFDLSSTGMTLDYDEDDVVKDLKKQIKIRKAELKAAYELFDKSGKTVIDEHGEVVPVMKIKTEASTTISVTFKEK